MSFIVLLCMGIIVLDFSCSYPARYIPPNSFTVPVKEFLMMMSTKDTNILREHVQAASAAFKLIVKTGYLDQVPEFVNIILERVIKPWNTTHISEVKDTIKGLRLEFDEIINNYYDIIINANSIVSVDASAEMRRANKMLNAYPNVGQPLNTIWHKSLMALFRPFIKIQNSIEFIPFYNQLLDTIYRAIPASTIKPKQAYLGVEITFA